MLLWYAAYGSNLSRERFAHYLLGGRPQGARRSYPGARDPSPPRGDEPIRLRGRLQFGWTSQTWGGGIAFFDPAAQASSAPEQDLDAGGDGAVRARAYLVSAQQFADLVAQEMHRDPGESLDLTPALAAGRHSFGPGRYETVHRVGVLRGVPVLTITAAEPAGLRPNAPTGAYLKVILDGLAQCHRLDPAQAADYLLQTPAIADAWRRGDLVELARAGRKAGGQGSI